MTSFRLSSGGRIDRAATLGFTFDGKALEGHPGDTLASALLANGIQLVGRSFKYHRPRGILTAGAAEPNALVTTGSGGRTEPNTRATMIELYQGLTAKSQNRWPSLGFDVGAVNGLLSPFLSAGFYYKTFMWPAALWEKLYEPVIRKAAGLGRASYEADPDAYEKCWAHCDLLVIGAGPAGLAAALTAGRAGARVILADEGAELGGSLLSRGAVDGKPADAVLGELLAELEGLANVRRLPRMTVFGWYDDNVFGAVERVQKHVALPDPERPVERLWRIVARQAILATGAEERPLVFGGNDIPGVMMAGAMRSYLNRQAVAPGQSTVIFTTNDTAYDTAADLEAVGLRVAAIVDSRADGGKGWQGRAEVLRGARVIDAEGGKRLRGVSIETADGIRRIDADALAISGGWSPVIHLACHSGSIFVAEGSLKA
ncbi:2Fe-2S iron-sulfur cluster-binding protein, partial [Rhizobium phaseoli]